jgi:hypothetical protein
MPMPFLNPLLAAEHRIRIDSGTAERVVVEASIRNGQASGTVKADYRNIKVSLLQKDSNKKKPLLTRLINWLLPGSKDDKDPPPDEGKIDYRRKPEDGFLRFLWKSTESGLIPTLLPVKTVPKGKGDKTVRD